jgi:transcriptional regulator with XRE-family HTH domain
MPDDSFGRRIRERRIQEGLSQDELAQRASLSRNYLSQIEREQATNLSWQVMERLATALGLTLEAERETAMTEEQLPPGLREFARAANLPSADIAMLARLQYRGRQPRTLEQWQIIYNVIKTATEA